MSVIYVLLAISILVALAFFAAFLFSVRSGQYDDTYTPSVRMLFEDEVVGDAGKTNQDTNRIKQKKSTNQ
ncbi:MULTISPECIES: cbb3-type cytochrome oxidase assembly protein CcoS [Flavobacteriaceae]|uniref:cbb3-type cytochrome oxidase assembly protein CcoS n=1 Tax=Flavobacteriaceae TaxID=49546 RepID=UPI001491CFA0|nr:MULTISPECIES: cbb3-type cytochrome oxidase assembly protein CcoS [Allomuricauda]MDC6367103.1 cbb3-type cytochrome oxidase assembly protein CcoS [Muricauda sp. AC10]